MRMFPSLSFQLRKWLKEHQPSPVVSVLGFIALELVALAVVGGALLLAAELTSSPNPSCHIFGWILLGLVLLFFAAGMLGP